VILQDEQLQGSSRQLGAAALVRRDADGVFIERVGRDSSCNAVSLLMRQVLALPQHDPKLAAAMDASWSGSARGFCPWARCSLAGNTRRGHGHEKSFGGGSKQVNCGEVPLALCHFGVAHDDPGLVALADRVRNWPSRASL